MNLTVYIIFALEAALAVYLILKYSAALPATFRVLCVFLTAAAFALRYICLDYETLDYLNFLTKWVDFFRKRGGFAALSESVGNYNIPYLYFLALFSYSSAKDLYLIKLLSILFDVLLAWGSLRLLGAAGTGRKARCLCFAAVLLLPTVILNGALWGQCDSMYTAMAVLAVAACLENRPGLSVCLAAVSFSFKLQAVFILPIFAVFLLTGRIKLRHVFLFPLTYVVLMIPAFIAGRPFMDTILLYFDQTGSIGSGLNYNSSSIFAAIVNVADTRRASRIAILCAFAYLALLLIICFVLRRKLNNKAIIAVCLLMSAGIPFILPHMHDRYFFCADIFSLLMAFTLPSLFPVALLTQYASLLGYHAYLKMRYLMPMRYGAAALVLVILSTVAGFIYCITSPGADSAAPVVSCESTELI